MWWAEHPKERTFKFGLWHVYEDGVVIEVRTHCFGIKTKNGAAGPYVEHSSAGNIRCNP